MKKFKEFINLDLGGFCMAVADAVPGVSGGTIAFILGFYDDFITSLDDLFRGTMPKKKKALKFLLKLGFGWIIGMGIASTVLSNLFVDRIYDMSSLFIGLIIFSLPLIYRDEYESIHNKYKKNIIYAILGCILVVLITIINNYAGINVDISSLNLFTIIYIFVVAMIAISAMVLPGISGSTMLLVFGIYIPIMADVKGFFHLDFSTLPTLIIFGLGVVFGIVFFVKLIRTCLDKNRSAVVYFILGMMIGSLYAIVMGPTTLTVPTDPMSISTFKILPFILGAVIIYLLELLKKYMMKNK